MRNVCLTCLSLLPVAAMAAYSIGGNVIDAVTGEPEPGALVKIHARNDTVKVVTSGVTDTDGNFKISIPGNGDYLLRVSFSGCQDALLPFKVSDAMSELNVGTVAMNPVGEKLEEVVVMGRRPVVESTGDKVTYNITEDPSAGQKTVLEMLRKVPMVTVDGEDNIRVNGSSNFQIYLNGRPNPMLSNNASQVLKSFPAGAIQKIEVILEPGAKYDAEGVGGILNIVTMGASDKSTDGSMATVTVGVDNRRANGSVYASAKKDKVTGSVNLSYFNGAISSQNMEMDMETYNYDSEDTYLRTQDGLTKSDKQDFIQGNLNLSWEPNRNNLFTVAGNIMYGTGKMNFEARNNIFDRALNLRSAYTENMKNSWDWGQFSVNTSYQHNFSSPEHNVVLSYQYDHGTSKSKVRTTDYDFTDHPSPLPAMLNHNNSPENSHTIQIDYTLPFASKYALETGAKGVFRHNSSEAYTLYGTTQEELASADGSDSGIRMKQNQDISALYASVSGKWGSLSSRAGLRWEYTHTSVDFLSGDLENFTANLNDIVPNLAVGYNISPVSNLRASYQMRIRRPSVSQMNPHRSVNLPGMASQGNPDLESEKSHNLSLTYSSFAGVFGFNLVGSYVFCNNSIGNYSFIDNDVIVSMDDNIGHSKDASLSAFFSYRPGSRFSATLNLTGRYRHLKFPLENITNSGWTGDFGANITYTMPWDVILNAYGGASLRNIELQGARSGFHYYGVSLSRNFLKEDRLKISVNAMNFAEKHIKMNVRSWDKTFYNKTTIRMPLYTVGVSVSYTFGGMNSQVKKTATSIVNDDVQQTSKGKGSSPI